MKKYKEKQEWLVLKEDDWQIVLPDFDKKPHGFPEKKEDKVYLAWLDCPCKPKIDVLNKIIIHNSFIDEEMIDEAISSLIKNEQET